MLFRKSGLSVFIHKEPIDMRFGFHRLTGLVKKSHGMQRLLDGHVFTFFGNNRFRIKILFFDGTGLVLLTKRIEKGRFMWVRDIEFEEVSFSELEQLVHGSVLVRSQLGVLPKRKPVAGLSET
jgi:transposase